MIEFSSLSSCICPICESRAPLSSNIEPRFPLQSMSIWNDMHTRICLYVLHTYHIVFKYFEHMICCLNLKPYGCLFQCFWMHWICGFFLDALLEQLRFLFLYDAAMFYIIGWIFVGFNIFIRWCMMYIYNKKNLNLWRA